MANIFQTNANNIPQLKNKKGIYRCDEQYKLKIIEANSNGTIFMAILRGKVCEGLDFADIYGRAVIIVGIPW